MPDGTALQERADAYDELHGYYIEELEEGATAVYSRTVTDADVVLFAGISGDTNPVHLNEEFSAGTVFKGRVAHGMLSSSYISTVIGTKLPGPGCIYVSQNLKFTAPVRAGDTVSARATITAIDRERRRVTMLTVCSVGDTVVIDGEAVVMVPSKAK